MTRHQTPGGVSYTQRKWTPLKIERSIEKILITKNKIKLNLYS